MLLPRIIPCLLICDGEVIKTVKFKDEIYVGDPLNAIKIFNEKKADEIIVLDICATQNNIEPNFKLIKNLAKECRMPLCYGGGIKSVDQAKKIISLGVEKIAISSAAVKNPQLITDIASQLGSQSVAVVLDVADKNSKGSYEVHLCRGKKSTGIDALNISKLLCEFGAGEIIINCIKNDGVMKGFDLDLLGMFHGKLPVPITLMGGAGGFKDFDELFFKYPNVGAAAGSHFIFKGPHKAILITYPSKEEKQKYYQEWLNRI